MPPNKKKKNGEQLAGQEKLGKPEQIDYKKVQENEMEVLESIYGDDFQRLDVEGGGAWKRREPCCKIHINSAVDKNMSVVLKIHMTATYPRTTPLLSIEDAENITESTKNKIRHVLETKPQALISTGSEAMVFDIASFIMELLDEAADARTGTLPSLEAERANREAEAAELAKASEAEEHQRKEMEAKEGHRVLQDEIDAVAKGRANKQRERRQSIADNSTEASEKLLSEKVMFDKEIRVTGANKNVVRFTSVTSKFEIRRGPVANIYTVRPVVLGSDIIPTLILKQSELRLDASSKNQMDALEAELQKVKNVKHRNVLDLYDFKFEKADGNEWDSRWTVNILMEYANKGSLEEILEVAGDLQIAKIRAWTIDLLDGLRFLHDHGIVHQDIQASNVLLVRDQFGEITAKLSDAGYQRQLNVLGDKKEDSAKVLSASKPAHWYAPELHIRSDIVNSSKSANKSVNKPANSYTQKTDVWDFGVVFLNMIFGMGVVIQYVSPRKLVESMDLSPALDEFIQKIFTDNPHKRPPAHELSSYEFLATDAEIYTKETAAHSSRPSVSSLLASAPSRRRNSSFGADNQGPNASRYKEDFYEMTKLGKGGFGEVMKVRKKLDKQFYAVKKIVQRRSSSTMTKILTEVQFLASLSNPYIVRYYGAWLEESDGDSNNEEAVTSSEYSSYDRRLDYNISKKGDIDFIGGPPDSEADDSEADDSEKDGSGEDGSGEDGSGEDDSEMDESEIDGSEVADLEADEFQENAAEIDDGGIIFGYDSGEQELDDNETSSAGGQVNGHQKMAVRHRTSSNPPISKPTRTILYIQMEYCPGRTLRDLINEGGLHKQKDEIWRLVRQLVVVLDYIHSKNVVHRDLKPENIFMDEHENVRIGDFGLATSAQLSSPERLDHKGEQTNMTRSVGTALYVAPEVRSTANGTYTAKVDMYSLGIIFFEMSYPPIYGHERGAKISRLRELEPCLPDDFDRDEKKTEAEIILSLLKHNPKERPSSSELLSSRKIPNANEEEQIREMVAKIADSESDLDSYKHIVNALFSIPNKPALDITWDATPKKPLGAGEVLVRNIVKDEIASIFRHHGALETQQALFFPQSKYYTDDIVKVLDTSGLVMQLPYDLTLPNARAVAKQLPPVLRSFTFGEVFRPSVVGGQPSALPTIGFNIVSTDTMDFAMKEAEVIKVIDEIIHRFPALDAKRYSFRLNHADLLVLIFQFCGIESTIHNAVAEVLSRRGAEWPWTKVHIELRGLGVSSTSIDDLSKFDFQDSAQIAIRKLQNIFKGSDLLASVSSALRHLSHVVAFLERFQVQCKSFISPLSSLNLKFYKGALMFQCMRETTKGSNKDAFPFAAGGRYDSLIREFRGTVTGKSGEYHAVGFNLSWQKMAAGIAKSQKEKVTGKSFLKKQEELRGIWMTRRCDVLVASFDAATLRSEGAEIVAKLWAHGISAELAVDARSQDDLLSKYAKDPHSWVVIIKQESMLKFKNLVRKDRPDEEIAPSQLINHLEKEINDRDQQNGHQEKSRTQRSGTHVESGVASNSAQEVRLLVADKKSKKTNRLGIVEKAQVKAAALANSFLEGPILAIETTDKVLNAIQETRLNDTDSWRQLIQSVPMAESKYIKDVLELLNQLASKNKSRHAFIYNFRSSTCIYYSLGADTTSLPVGKGRDRDMSIH